MHAETLAYLIHQLPYHAKHITGPASPAEGRGPMPRDMDIPAGQATLGQVDPQLFGWDNEFPPQVVTVPSFSIDRYNITNEQYAVFLADGGSVPYYWTLRDDGTWVQRGMFEDVPLPPAWPVYVTHDQASAYARWQGRRLPTEAEWHRAAYGRPDGAENANPWGNAPPAPQHGNFGFQWWDPVGVADYPLGDSAFGVSQMIGNGWEWTATPFAPFPGFVPMEHYPGYSANFFDGEHYVLKGASPRTANELTRRSFRNWFRPEYPYVYATFRTVTA